MKLVSATALVLALSSCRPSTPTFTRDVAPILYARCASCHRPGGAAPFSLLGYEEVRSRARQIVDVTSTRFMPPWLPEPGYGSFEDERVLAPEEIDVLRRWVEGGVREGRLSALPPVPNWTDGWELGEPDVVAEMPVPFELLAEGRDVFRNFVLPVPLDRTRYVRAIEFHANDRRLVHHATITLDATGSARRIDAEDERPGFDGMRAAPGAVMPDGHFLGWTPGMSARWEPDGMSWRLERGSDLVVQLHMPSTGKPERVSASVGLFLTDEAPRILPLTLRLGSRRFEIPAGEEAFTIEDDYVLPIDVEAVSVYPHAHYLAREMRAKAVLPDGSVLWLLWIRAWDFNWQDFYRYREPVVLPRGTRIEMSYVYDNSENNPRNPSSPPGNVVYGPQSTDEMGDLYLQVVPRQPSEIEMLRADHGRKELEETVAELTFRLERRPTDAAARNSLGVAYDALGREEEALQAFQEALLADPELRDAHFNLGALASRRGAHGEAIERFRKALRSDPACIDCRLRIGNAMRDQGRYPEAVIELQEAVDLDPARPWAQYSLGVALQLAGRVAEAVARYRAVVELEPENAEVRLSLGSALVSMGECTPAILALERAVRLAPHWPEAKSRTAYALAQCPRAAPDAMERAVALATEAAEATRYEDPDVLSTLVSVLEATELPEHARRARELRSRLDDLR